jgi:hypothetical protein
MNKKTFFFLKHGLKQESRKSSQISLKRLRAQLAMNFKEHTTEFIVIDEVLTTLSDKYLKGVGYSNQQPQERHNRSVSSSSQNQGA